MRLLVILAAACTLAVAFTYPSGAARTGEQDQIVKLQKRLKKVTRRNAVLVLEREAWKRQAFKWRAERNLSRARAGQRVRELEGALALASKRWTRDSMYAIRLAARTFGVDEGEMFRIAKCESNFNPFAKNRSSTASGLFQWLDSSWASQGIAGFSVWDPVANAMAAARARDHDGSWRQWECRP